MKSLLLLPAALLFSPAVSTAAITYVDAASANTTLANGNAYTPTASLINNDNEWSSRPLGNGATVYTANDSNANPGEDAPLIRTTLSGLTAGATYEVYVFFWGAGNDAPTGNQRWDIQAGLSAGTLTFYDTQNAVNLGHASTGVNPATYFTNSSPTVIVSEVDRRLYQISLGATTASLSGEIQIFVDDVPGNVNRTWYDGVGHLFVVPEPSSALLGALGVLGLLRRRRA